MGSEHEKASSHSIQHGASVRVDALDRSQCYSFIRDRYSKLNPPTVRMSSRSDFLKLSIDQNFERACVDEISVNKRLLSRVLRRRVFEQSF